MDGLLSQRPFRERRIAITVLVSLGLHVSLVGLAAIWPTDRGNPPPPELVTLVEAGPIRGEAIPDLIAPRDEPVPTPDSQPAPPPEDKPAPDDTPPPSDDPEVTAPQPPKKFDGPKLNKPAGTPYPANIRRGDHPQPGVPGGASPVEKTTGVPGYEHSGAAGWHKPEPPYPAAARIAHITGSGSVRCVTDSSGRVISAVIVESAGSAILDRSMTSFARANWSGPPNSTLVIPFTYRFPN